MHVFLLPLGARRHELYCEIGEQEGEPQLPSDGGWTARLEARFRAVIAVIERRSRGPSDTSWARVRNRLLGWLAERVAEQRLLWHLRLHREAVLHFPDDLSHDEALAIMRQVFRGDITRHRVWLVVNGLLLALAGLLTVIPGPNVVAFYFAFRVVGHYMSLRGARHGLDDVAWQLQPSAPLTELRRAFMPGAAERTRTVSEVAARLELERLTAFVERMALRGA